MAPYCGKTLNNPFLLKLKPVPWLYPPFFSIIASLKMGVFVILLSCGVVVPGWHERQLTH